MKKSENPERFSTLVRKRIFSKIFLSWTEKPPQKKLGTKSFSSE